MQKTSELWKQLLTDSDARRVYTFEINGVEYGEGKQFNHTVQASLFDEFGIGNAVSAELSLSIPVDEGDEQIPRGAKIVRYVQLIKGDQRSEKLQKGVFYISKRENDGYTMTFTCYDAMRKADNYWVIDSADSFPMAHEQAVKRIAEQMGIGVDSRNSYHSGYTIDMPTPNMTMRDILGWIAAANGGNFYISDEGNLRLKKIGDVKPIASLLIDENAKVITFGDKDTAIIVDDGVSEAEAENITHDVGLDIVSGSANGNHLPVSRVTLSTDEIDYTAGDDTGTELYGDCFYASEQIAKDVLKGAVGYEYVMYEATAANVDPAFELGDGISVDGVTSIIAKYADDGSGYIDASAPGALETTEEYPGNDFNYTTRRDRRRNAGIMSAIDKSNDSIKLYIDDIEKSIRSEIDVLDGEIRQEITDMENNASSLIDQKLDSITLRVSGTQTDGSKSYADITLTIDGDTQTGRVNILGDVEIDGNLVANALYAVRAYFNALVAGEVNTQNNISRYIEKNKDSYIFTKIDENGIQLNEYYISGNVLEGQAESDDGKKLYWEKSVAGAQVLNGWYYDMEGHRIGITTENTGFPVSKYLGSDLPILKISALDYDANEPRIDIAINDESGGLKIPGHLRHDGEALNLYVDADGGKYGVFLGFQNQSDMPENDVTGKPGQVIIKGDPLILQGLAQPVSIDFSGWDNGTFAETMSDGTTRTYSVNFDEQNRPIAISETSGAENKIAANIPQLEIKW